MNFIIVRDFLLKDSIYSGQFFNFKHLEDDSFLISNKNEVFRVKQCDEKLFFEGINKENLIIFFGLKFNLNRLKNFEDIYFQEAFIKYRGLRIMKIDLFQTIISFVCSAAANQKKIENNIKLISKNFGRYNDFYDFYEFPDFDKINDEKILLECKVGYRAKFILGICRFLEKNPAYLDEILNSNYKKSKDLLIKLPGVGSKVADCICLFSLNHYEAFPVDTWIKKMIKNWYGFECNNQEKLELFVQEKFGNLGGYYQQYLFHLLRNEEKVI